MWVSIRWANLDFHTNIKHHYCCNSFFVETISKKHLFYLSSVYGIKCLGEIYKQLYHLKIYGTNSFDDSTDYQNKVMFSIDSSENCLIFWKNFLNFWFDATEWQSVINLSRYKSYASVVHGDSEVTFLRKEEDGAFCPSLLCSGYIRRYKIKDANHQIFMSSILFGLFRWGLQVLCF